MATAAALTTTAGRGATAAGSVTPVGRAESWQPMGTGRPDSLQPIGTTHSGRASPAAAHKASRGYSVIPEAHHAAYHKHHVLFLSYTVIRFVWISVKFGTCTVVDVNWTLVEAKMFTFSLDSTNFIFNKCPIYTYDGASAKFSTNSHETDYSVFAPLSLSFLTSFLTFPWWFLTHNHASDAISRGLPSCMPEVCTRCKVFTDLVLVLRKPRGFPQIQAIVYTRGLLYTKLQM